MSSLKFGKSDVETDDERKSSGVVPESREPEDKGNVAYYLMLLFGIGALLPWNAILTALDFFK